MISNQIGGKYIKKIFPNNIPGFPFTNYKDYLDNFITYIQINKHKLYNLKLMIGASNSGSDLKKFNLDYDIVINQGMPDLKCKTLLQLSSDSDVKLSSVEILEMLAWFLPNKFIEIRYNHDVSSLISTDELADSLHIFKTLLKSNGKIFLDISRPEGNTKWYLDKDRSRKSKDLFLYIDQDFSNLKQIEDHQFKFKFREIRPTIFLIRDSKPFKTQINNFEKLFTYRKPNGGFNISDLENINLFTNEEVFDQNLFYLKKIFNEDKFIISSDLSFVTKKEISSNIGYDILYICDEKPLFDFIDENNNIVNKIYHQFELFNINSENYISFAEIDKETKKYNLIFVSNCVQFSQIKLLDTLHKISKLLLPNGIIYMGYFPDTVLFEQVKKKMEQLKFKLLFTT